MHMASTCPSPETHRKYNHNWLDYKHLLIQTWLKGRIYNTRRCCWFLHHFHLPPPRPCVFLSTFKNVCYVVREFSPPEESVISGGQDNEGKSPLKILPHSTKRRQEAPSSLKFSNSFPRSSSTCLHEDWQPESGTYYAWKHRQLTTRLTVGPVKLV